MTTREPPSLIVDLPDLDDAIAALFGGMAGMTLIDRLETDTNQALPKLSLNDKGALFFGWPESENDRSSSRQRSWSRSQTVLEVVLWHRVNPHSQRASRRAALTSEAAVRAALTDPDWNAATGCQILYDRTPVRTIVQEVYRVEMRFVVHHTIRVGVTS